jgi:large subunit ribosomal protein L25
MIETLKIEATQRAKAGKGTAREARRQGHVPAVIYGDKKEPTMINLSKKTLDRHLHTKAFMNHIVEIVLDGKSHQVLTRDVQYDPISDFAIHLDFLRVNAKTEIIAHVPVEFLNLETCPGIKKGGILNIVSHTVDLRCEAGSIPEQIIFDLKNSEVGDSIHINQFDLPKGVKPVAAGDFTVATVIAPPSLKSEESETAAEPEAEAAAEGKSAETKEAKK